MEDTPEQLLEKVRNQLAALGDRSAEFVEELGKLIPKAETEEPESVLDTTKELSEAITKMKISQVTKLRNFKKGENFSRFCERFQEFVYIMKMEDTNLHLYFLQHVDDSTYSTLKAIPLSDVEKQYADLFCKIYKDVIYGSDIIPLKNELLECKQLANEDITEYAYRLREKASIAFSEPENIDMNCMLALMRGIKDSDMRRKLNESSVTDFNEALRLAKKLEKVDHMINETPAVSSIMKNSAVRFSEISSSREQSESPKSDRSRTSNDSWNSFNSQSKKEDIPGRSRDRSNSSSWSRSSSKEYNRDKSRDYGNDVRGRSRSPFRRENRDGRNQIPWDRNATPRYRPRGRVSSYQQKACWACHKIGHIRRDCWQKNRYSNYRGRPNTFSTTRTPNPSNGNGTSHNSQFDNRNPSNHLN